MILRINKGYEPKFGLLPSKLGHLSEVQIQEHWSIYLQYCADLNKLDYTDSNYSSVRNNVILHELYFQNLNGVKSTRNVLLETTFINNFGSYDLWENNFIDLAKVGTGWLLLLWDPSSNRFMNLCVKDQVPINVKILLVFDLFEHAYSMDYRYSKKYEYAKSFTSDINWSTVSNRLFDQNYIY